MKIELAYSTDFKDVIDAEQAYDLYWAGIIQDKKNFECPGENCSAAITCANLDKLRREMKQVPHFRLVGEHSKECNEPKECVNVDKPFGSRHRTEELDKVDSTTDIFMLERPRSHYYKKSTDEKESSGDKKSGHSKEKKKTYSKNTRQSPYYSIKPLVSKFARYSDNYTLDQHFINLKGYNISYSTMFVKIDNQSIDDLSKYFRIYYGPVTVSKHKESGAFIVRFKNTFSYESQDISPSIFISKELIETQFMKKYWNQLLEDLLQVRNETITCYFYGIPKVKPKDDKIYINLPIHKFDYLDIQVDK